MVMTLLDFDWILPLTAAAGLAAYTIFWLAGEWRREKQDNDRLAAEPPRFQVWDRVPGQPDDVITVLDHATQETYIFHPTTLSHWAPLGAQRAAQNYYLQKEANDGSNK